MITALVIGALAGAFIPLTMARAGMLAERSGLAVLLAAIAFFYPVFAVAAEAPTGVIVFHAAVFCGFVALALYGFKRGTWILAAGMIAHGLFDAYAVVIDAPSPVWWPAFCGALDIAAGLTVLILLRKGTA